MNRRRWTTVLLLLALHGPSPTRAQEQGAPAESPDAIRRMILERRQDPEVRIDIMRSLVGASNFDDPFVFRVVLETMLADEDRSVRRKAAEYLSCWPTARLPTPDAKLERELRDATHLPWADVRCVAIDLIGRTRCRGKPALDRLTELLDAGPETRWRAARSLGHLGPAARPAVAQLLAMIDDADHDCRQEAIGALGKIGEAQETVPALIAALWHRDPRVRADAAQALGRIGFPGALGAVEPLRELLAATPADMQPAEQARLRVSAAFALASMGAVDDAVFEALAKPVQGRDQDVRQEAVELIAELGPKARRLTPMLMAQLNEPLMFTRCGGIREVLPTDAVTTDSIYTSTITTYSICIRVPYALAQIGDAALPPLTEALADRNWLVRLHAAEALGLMGPTARDAVPQLQRLLDDERKYVRNVAREAIERILAVETDGAGQGGS